MEAVIVVGFGIAVVAAFVLVMLALQKKWRRIVDQSFENIRSPGDHDSVERR